MSSRALFWMVSFLTCSAMVLGACGEVLGIPGEKKELPSAPDCHPELDTNVCFQCTDESCCAEYQACQADGRCVDYYKSCLPDCKKEGLTFDECVLRCDDQNGAGHAVYQPYHACTERHCLAPCTNDAPDACTACLWASCVDAVAACDNSRPCDTLLHCLLTCVSSDDHDACARDCRSGVSAVDQALLNEELTCALTYCSACGRQLPF